MANYRPQYNQQQKPIRVGARNPAEQAAYDARVQAAHGVIAPIVAPIVPGAPIDPYLAVINAEMLLKRALINPGFTETLGPERPNNASAEITSFWKTEIIKIFDKKRKEVEIIIKSQPRYNHNNPILQNFQGYTNVEISDIGTIIVPILDEVRIREILPDQIQFNEAIGILTIRRAEIILIKDDIQVLPDLLPVALANTIMPPATLFIILNLLIANNPDENVMSPLYRGVIPALIGYDIDSRPFNNIDQYRLLIQNNRNYISRYLININKLKIINSMMQYPQNSNLENYILITDFLSNANINTIWAELLRLLGNPNAHPNSIQEYANAYFQYGYILDNNRTAPFTGYRPYVINKRNFLALMVLVSRNSKDGYLLTNNARKLYSDLLTLFNETNDVNIVVGGINVFQARIIRIFTAFIIIIRVSDFDYINKILNGYYIYKIYKNNIDDSYLFGFGIEENELKGRKQVIEKEKNELKTRNYNNRNILTVAEITIRIKKWVTQSLYETDIVPLSYILDKYTEEEKKVLIRNNEMCKEISEITSKLGPLPFPNILPVDFFVKENISDESASNFIETAGPTIVKDSQKDRRRKFFEERGPNIGVRGGNKPTRKYYKNGNGTRNGTRKVI